MMVDFYIAYQEEDAYGFSFAVVYIPSDRNFQISMMLFNMKIAVGCIFKNGGNRYELN